MATKKKAQSARFVLLPIRGLMSDDMRRISGSNADFAAAASSRLTVMRGGAGERKPNMKVIHSIKETGRSSWRWGRRRSPR
jgi:hypothetical protein